MWGAIIKCELFSECRPTGQIRGDVQRLTGPLGSGQEVSVCHGSARAKGFSSLSGWVGSGHTSSVTRSHEFGSHGVLNFSRVRVGKVKLSQLFRGSGRVS